MPDQPMPNILLRPVLQADFDTLFAMMADPVAVHMAAFTPPNPDDRAAFDARYTRILGDPTVMVRTIVLQAPDGEQVVGSILRYFDEGHAELSYWVDRAYWGQGIASDALRRFVGELPERPLFARAAADNLGSLRVLERNGFVPLRTEQGFAPARNATIDELLLAFPAPATPPEGA
ncbi:MAG: GNAT family N-acetyltransferase [Caldilineaceae bacterium]